MQLSDLRTCLHTEFRVEVRERLVHQEDLRLANDGAAHRHSLTLATGQRLGLAIEVRLEIEHLRDLFDAGADLRLVGSGELERKTHVLGHRHVRVQRVVLEDHRDVALFRLLTGDVAVADEDASTVDVFEPGEHAQGGRLSAAGGSDEDEELAVLDLEVELVHCRGVRSGEQAGGALESH